MIHCQKTENIFWSRYYKSFEQSSRDAR